MFFISVEDFLTQTSAIPRLSRAEEDALVLRMTSGDVAAREAFVRSYLPLVMSHVCRVPQEICTLNTIYACIATVEKSVDNINALRDSEAFARHLGWGFASVITAYFIMTIDFCLFVCYNTEV